MLARLFEGSVEEIAAGFRLAQEGARDAGAQQHQWIGALSRHPSEQSHALVEVRRPI